MEGLTFQLGNDLQREVEGAVGEWLGIKGTDRLLARDSSLWTGEDEGGWLGWLDTVDEQFAGLPVLKDISREMGGGAFSDAVLLGMGGSSLCPEVLSMTFGAAAGHPRLHVLDSTDPSRVANIARAVDLRRSLIIVSSKSGTTLEPNIFEAYFYDLMQQVSGSDGAGDRFIAITDPGSKLEALAGQKGFRRVFHGSPSVGGRFSALSPFGTVPASILGIDVERFLSNAREMVSRCMAGAPEENPGVLTGILLGASWRAGRDKITFIISPSLTSFGAWLEQLIAESTGKEGKAIIPIAGEPAGTPGSYGRDRVFVYIRLSTAPDPAQDRSVDALAAAGMPVVRVDVPSLYHLGAEFFRWEVATAVAGSLMGINPFNQPDVEASKVETRALTDAYERSGRLPGETSALEEGPVKVFADAGNLAELRAASGGRETLAAYLRAHLSRIRPGDYFAILAFIEMSRAHEGALQGMRERVRRTRSVATSLGFGPRFLHSTGQAFKGGPNSGVFIQITCDNAVDIPVPGHRYTFGVVKEAQARGDLQVLADRGRRLLRLHLAADTEESLRTIDSAFQEALQ